MSYEIIDVNSENVDSVGLFCKQSQKSETGYQNKFEWIKQRFEEGLKYKMLRVSEGKNKKSLRGLIEYIPGEFNWRGIKADNFMVIHCLWIIGKHKMKGYASKMVDLCINDAKDTGFIGVVGMSAEKGAWLPKRQFYIKNGFTLVDIYEEKYELYVRFFGEPTEKPSFYPLSEEKRKQVGEGITMYYTHQCPYISAMVEDVRVFAKKNNKKFTSILLKTAKEVHLNQLHPYGTFTILCDGEIIPYKPGMKNKTLAEIKK